jgi:hypothetical protein
LEARVRSWFLRNALDVLERAHGASAPDRVKAAVPKRLAPLLSPERFRNTGPLDAVPLEDAEDLLFAIDGVIGNGAGGSMEAIAEAVVSRAILDGAASVSTGDLIGSVTRLRGLFETPFVGAELLFEISRTPEGFTLAIGVHGRPRVTRLLRHYAIGAIRAAARFAREPGAEDLRVSGESIADRALVTVSLRESMDSRAPISRPRSKPPGPRNGNPGLQLSAEVERILGHRGDSERAEDVRRDSTPPPPSKRNSERPPGRTG